jgi:hypothetical protein
MQTHAMWLVALALAGCGNKNDHKLPVILVPDATPSVDLAKAKDELGKMFGPSKPAMDLEAEIAKLEAQKATLPAPQRPLIDRTIANMRAQDAAMRERDPVKARPLQIAVSRETLSLLEAMAAADPDNAETQLQVGSSLQTLAFTVESLDIADEVKPGDILKRARDLAERNVTKHPDDARRGRSRAR